MMTYSELLGTHGWSSRQGMTIQEFYELLKQIPIKVRESNYMMVIHPDGSIQDVRGLHFAQSDQAEKWEFNVYISLTAAEGE